MKRIVRYRRRSELCRECRQPIEHEPTTDGNWYGWRPTDGRCYACHTIALFGVTMQPSEAWWRMVRRLVQAGHRMSLFNDSTGLDDDVTF